MRRFVIGPKAAGQRADVFVASKYTDFSRSSLAGLFSKKMIALNDSFAKAGERLRVGDILKVDTSLLGVKPAKIDLPIIYEDRDVIVLNKPAGVLTHSKGALNDEATVASFIKPKITDKSLVGNRAGIVHRLDRMTSGVIIIARNQASLKWLQKQFSTRRVMKSYVAIVEGTPKNHQAKIDAPIGRNPKKPQTFKVISSGKPAQTQYRVAKSFKKAGKTYSLLELWPFTGRTHQLRVHLAYIGHPVVGDAIYGHPASHMYLHAKSLELILPTGKKHSFTVPTPSVFKDFQAGPADD